MRKSNNAAPTANYWSEWQQWKKEWEMTEEESIEWVAEIKTARFISVASTSPDESKAMGTSFEERPMTTAPVY